MISVSYSVRSEDIRKSYLSVYEIIRACIDRISVNIYTGSDWTSARVGDKFSYIFFRMNTAWWQNLHKVWNSIMLDIQNFGPPPKDSGIKVNEVCFSVYEPQAWVDDFWNWFYNFSAALRLEKILWRRLPNIQELIKMIHDNPDNFRQNAGYRIGNDGEFFERGHFSTFWSGSTAIFGGAYCAYLKNESVVAGKSWSLKNRGLSLRFIIDQI